MQPPPQRAVPLLYDTVADVTDGYYGLEELEREAGLELLLKHAELVKLWYRLLTLYTQAVLRGFEKNFEQSEDVEVRMSAWATRMRLIAIGVGSSKAALDTLMAGYYNVAFAATRHMLETFVQCRFLDRWPEEIKHWYADPNVPGSELEPPSCTAMVDDLKGDASADRIIDVVHAFWKLMCKGAHPSGEGLVSTVEAHSLRNVVGPTYDEGLCRAGFDAGLFGTLLMLSTIGGLTDQPEAWSAEADEIYARWLQWRQQAIPDDERRPVPVRVGSLPGKSRARNRTPKQADCPSVSPDRS